MTDKEKEDLARVEAVLQSLGEHYDSVHIFATRHESGEFGGTVNVNRGIGNWFARYGQIHDWLIKETEESRIHRRKTSTEEGGI